MKKTSLTTSHIFILIVLVISSLVLFGWFSNIGTLVQVHKDFAPMQFNTALCFLLITGSLIARTFQKVVIARLLALVCLLIASLTGLQYITGTSLWIDEFFMRSHIAVKTSHPGRMSPITSICFTTLSLYTLIGTIRYKFKSNIISHIKTLLLIPVLYLSMTALFRYIIGESSPYVWQIYTQMAAHTSLCFLCLSVYAFNARLLHYSNIDRVQLRQSSALSLGIYLIFVAFSTSLNKNENNTTQTIFSQEVQAIKSESSISLKLQVDALERMAKRIGNGSYPEQAAFTSDALQYIKHFGNIQAIEWVNSDNIIKWIAPLRGNEAVVGKDLNKEVKRNTALQKAIASKKPVFSPVINLIQGGKGCLLFIPVFKNQDTPFGYLATVYKVQPLLASLIGINSDKFNITLSQDNKFVTAFSQNPQQQDTGQKSISLNEFGLDWKILFTRNSLYQFHSKSYYPELILLLGTLISFFIGNVIYLNWKISFKNLEINRIAKVKTDFLANMSHEIRTPLNGVIGLTELLSESIESDGNKRKIKLIKRSADSLLALVNDILDLSKLENGNITLEKRAFNLTELADEVIYLFTPIATDKSIHLKLHIDKEIRCQLFGDENRIKQILSNLISNAIKFTEKGSVQLIITQSNNETDLVTHFQVQDSGIGIPIEHQNKVFEKFTQADSSVNRKYGGTGLGLSICRSLATVMGGSIQFKSQTGVGSTFTVHLPLKVQEETEQHPLPSQPQPIAKMSFTPLRILTAEDNEINQVVLKGMVKKAGFDTDLVNNGIETLAALQTKPYDLILMDCQMPEMDGYTATKKIIEIYGNDRPVIIAVTASTNENDIKRCYEAGMDDTISKPINFPQLSEKLLKLASSKIAS